MSQSSDSEQNTTSPQPKIHQNASGNLGGGQQAIYGNYNSQYQDNRTFNIYSSEPDLPEELVFKSWKDLLLNYLKTVFFLFSVLISWLFMGLFASHAFPKTLATSLIQYTLHGFWNHIRTPKSLIRKTSSPLWEGIKLSIDNLPSLTSIEVTNDKSEAEKLNKLDSQYWLLARLAEGFQGCKEFDDIFWKIRELEEQRSFIVLRLEPLKTVYLKELNSFQNFITNLPSLSNKSKKYDQIEKILNELAQSYAYIESASELQIQEFIEILRDRTARIPNTQSLYNVLRLVDWVYAQARNSKVGESDNPVIDSDYPPIRALKDKQKNYKPKYHVPDGCVVGYPKVERPEDKERIDFYESIEDAEKAGREICHNCRKKLTKHS